MLFHDPELPQSTPRGFIVQGGEPVTDEEHMKTSEIMARLNHSSLAVTRSWIKEQGLKATEYRDAETGEKLYRRSTVEEKIAAMPRGPRGPYRKRPPDEEPPGDHDGLERELPD